MQIALLSSFTADLLPPLIKKLLQERHIETEFYVSGFDQYRQEILDPASGFYRAEPEVVILLLDSQDVLADLIQNPFDFLPEQREARVENELMRLREYVELMCARLPKSIFFLNTLAAPPLTSLGFLEGNSPYSVRGAVAEYNAGLLKMVRQMTHTYIIDCEALAAEIGWREWADERLWLLARMRLSRSALDRLARCFCSAIWAVQGTAKKVLVLDADNTLWGGNIGTDGLQGIQLGHEGIGLAYRQFQAEILNLYKRGILLALASKNNPEDVFEVLEKHPAMLLKREHFATLCVNWQDKATSLREIAEQLNLGLESFVFADDSPFECAWVQDQLPEVQVFHLPADPAELVGALRQMDAFATFGLTEEDQRRGQIYHEQQQRKELQQSARTIEEFYASLDMHALIRQVTPATLARTAQLTQKTNQFNLTTRRYTESELSMTADQAATSIFTISLRDRFGDNGLVGVAMVVWERETARIDTFLLSCRVMGRTVETAFLAFVAECAQAHGARYLLGEFLPTPKNAPARDFYKLHGFEPLDDESRYWRYDLSIGSLRAPWYITLDLSEEAKGA